MFDPALPRLTNESAPRTFPMTRSEVARIDRPLRVSAEWTLLPDELKWRFSRSSGPGGQGVNTADSRVELTWTPDGSPSLRALGDQRRSWVLDQLAGQLINGAVVITASEHRAQLRNREAARLRLQHVLRLIIAAPSVPRRPSRPTRGSIERRLSGKKVRAGVKASRARPPID